MSEKREISVEELLACHAGITGNLAGVVVAFEPGTVVMVPAVHDGGEGLSLNYFRVVKKESTDHGFTVEFKHEGVHGVIQTPSMKKREIERVARELSNNPKEKA